MNHGAGALSAPTVCYGGVVRDLSERRKKPVEAMLDKSQSPVGESDAAATPSRDAPLLACLAFVARALGLPFSETAVLSGLPVRDGALSVDLFPRAAGRAGLNAQLFERAASRVPGLVVPYIVLLKNGEACVVVAKHAEQEGVDAVFPAASEDVRRISYQELDADASGYVIYVTRAEEEDRAASGAARAADGHWLWSRVAQFWPSWAQVVCAALVINLLGLALPLFVMNVYDRVIPNLAIPTLWALAAGVVLALFFDFALKQLRAVVLDRTGRRVDMAVAASLFEHALGVSMAERTASSGAIANQIREFELVRDFFTSSSIIAATDLLFIGVFIAVLWAIVGPIAWVPLIAVPLVLGATLLVQIPLSRSVQATQSEASRRHAILVESLIGVEAIKAVAGEGVMQRRWEDAVAATARANSATKFWSSLALYFTAFVQQAVSVVIIVWGVFLVAEGEISIGGLIAANILAGRVLAPLGNIAMTLARAQQAFAALGGLTAFMGLGREQAGAVGEGRTVRGGAVAFKEVSFTYPGGSDAALKEVSFSIKPGERVGIIGRIGSGKTTIGRLLAGLYQTDTGTVSVDGVNVRRFEPADLRAGVTYLGQECELFAGTLRDNIVLGKPHAGEEEVAEAARIAGVEAFTAAHPLGLAMPVGERGRGLSGGQRQAVAIARILLRKPQVLFLDEPASAMDTATEAALIASLREGLQDAQTLIVCTHRPSVLEIVDRLIVLDGGRIAADGPRDAVIKALQESGKGGKGAKGAGG